MKKRYEFSKYLLDPLKHSFTMIVHIMAYVIRFSKLLIDRIRRKLQINHHSTTLTEDEISAAEKYYFKKASKEVHHFVSKSKYDKISTEKDDVLLYTGRILPTKGVSIVGKFTDVMKDLSTSTFCVPILERYSPIAYSISLDVHLNDAMVKHSGIETTHKGSLKESSCY